MENLQAGDVLTRISDGSKWKFLHYKPLNTGKFSSTPQEDKNFIHVRQWDNETNDWTDQQKVPHEEFPTSEFEKEFL